MMEIMRRMVQVAKNLVSFRMGNMELKTSEIEVVGKIEEEKNNGEHEEVAKRGLKEEEDMLEEEEVEESKHDIRWLAEEDVVYIVERWTGGYDTTWIGRVKESLRNLLEDNEDPDVMKWLETSHELEVFCEAALEAGRDVMDFDEEVREILDAVWILMEFNEDGVGNGEEEDDGEDEDLERLVLGDGEEGPEYYQVRL